MRPKRGIQIRPDQNNLVCSETKRMRKYRESVKNDPEKYEKIKAKDKERKHKERERQRQAKQVDKALENELKRQKKWNSREDLGQSKKKKES